MDYGTIDGTVASLVEAAAAGAGAAARELADRHRTGDGVPRDETRALHWYSIGAQLGDADAQNTLGSMLFAGSGCTPDPVAAVRWYAQSAHQGHPLAQYNLGKRYLHGIGIEQDDRQAVHWFAQAARQNNPYAACELATMHRLGRGTEPDLARAAELHVLAARAGDPVARGCLSDYREDLARLALDGRRQAALALCRMYESGLGVDENPAETWGWVRWAHDGCPPLPQAVPAGGPTDDGVADAFRFLLGRLTLETRRLGERLLAERLHAAGKPREGRPQVVLQVGTANGGLSLIGQWSPAGWVFRSPQRSGPAVGKPTDRVKSWRSPLKALGAWPWHHACPFQVHPEFAERFWQAYRAQTGGHGAYLEQWRQLCGKAAGTPVSAPGSD